MRERPIGRLAVAALVLVALECATVVSLSATGRRRDQQIHRSRPQSRLVAHELQLTDLAMSTGTSYTRHPSLADFFAAHSSHPNAMDPFPAGSVVGPPLQASRPTFRPRRR